MQSALAPSFVTLAAFAVAAAQTAGQRNGMAIPITKSSWLIDADKSINFDVPDSYAMSVEAKILRGFDNFEKNIGKPHPYAMRGVRKHGYPDTLEDFSALWCGAIAVGTPFVDFTVTFDTGSSDLFLPSIYCDSSCGGHNLWDPTSSSTAQDLGRAFTLSYGGETTTCSGEEYTDVVAISNFTATSQTFGAATSYSPVLSNYSFPADGLIGLAFRPISMYGASPFFETLVSEGQVLEPIFSFKLSSSGGELYIGGSNPAMYIGDFSYASVTQQGFWQVTMDNIQGNGQTILGNLPAIIDTGSTSIYGPSGDVSTLHSTLGGAVVSYAPDYYTISCSSFPNISLSFGGTSFQIPSSALNLGPLTPGSTDCVSAVRSWGTGIPFWVIGDTFLQGVYTSFDVGNSRVGFATLA